MATHTSSGFLDAVKRIAGKSTITRSVARRISNTYNRYYGDYSRSVIKRKLDYWGRPILKPDDGNELIARYLESGQPSAIAKIGSAEGAALGEFMESRGDIVTWRDATRLALYRNAGVFPPDDDTFHKWCLVFKQSLANLDIIGLYYWVPYESRIVKEFAPHAKLTGAGALRWHEHRHPWTRCLGDRRVLVVHPFQETIRRQFPLMDRIWQDDRQLPRFELDTVKVPLSDALTKSRFKNWFDALEQMKTEIEERRFDLAIVGAGAYSIPLVAHIKTIGKAAIHLGGQTQLLFGIKGGRWDALPMYSQFYNSYWCRPSHEETPDNVSIIEDGCYW